MGGVVGRLLHEFAVVIGVAMLISGFVSLTLTPMLCSRFLRPPHAGGGSRLYQLSERFFAGMLAAYDRSLSWTLRHRRTTMAVLAAHLRPHRLPVRADPEGLHPERGQWLDPGLHGGRPGHLLRGDDGQATGGGRHRQEEPARRAVHVLHRRERIERGAQYGPDLHPAQAARGAAADRAGDRPAPPPGLVVPGIRVYPQVLPTIRIGGQLTKALYQYTLQDTDLAGALPLGAHPVRPAPAASRPAGREHGSSDHQPPGDRPDRPRQGRGARRDGGPDRVRARQRVWRQAGLDVLHPVQPVPGHPGARPDVPARCDVALAPVRALERGQAGAAGCGGEHPPGRRARSP